MGKVGLITLFIYNYGSLLQAFSTRTFLEKNGFEPELIEMDPMYPQESEISRARERHPEFEEHFNSFMASLAKNDSLVPEESVRYMDKFRRERLKIVSYTYEELKRIGESGEYDRFIVGSDQVWNTTIGLVSDFFFLRFAPPEKRVALCPSFGAGQVYDYLKEEMSKVLSEYGPLSSREDEGVAIIKELTGRDAVRLSDPTIFLTADEWREIAGVSDADEKGYIMLHFLDRPYEAAVRQIHKIASETGLPVKCFAAAYEEFSDIVTGEPVVGGPEVYIKTISNAALVCTDSFHTSIFSINLDTDFYTFDRQYVHGVSQISRITTLLHRYGLEDRLILKADTPINTDDMAIHADVESIKTDERNAISSYLLSALGRK